jgi:cell division inhibitor SepF
MSGSMRKLGLYLGLVEDDEDARERRYDDDRVRRRGPARGGCRASSCVVPPLQRRRRRRTDSDAAQGPRAGRAVRTRGAVALDTAPRPASVPSFEEGYRITTLHPRTYNEARQIGEHFRKRHTSDHEPDGDGGLGRQAPGGLRGRVDLRPSRQHRAGHGEGLPALAEHVEVTAEDKARIAESGFFNQS